MTGRHSDDTVADFSRTPASGHALADAPTEQFGVTARANGATAPVDGETADVDLGADPFDDNLSAELAARQPRRLTPRTTLVLGGAVLAVAGFLGGVLVQKNFGPSATTSTTGAAQGPGAGRFPGGGGAGGGAGGGGAGGGTAGGGTAGGSATGSGGTTTGTVKLVDGTTVYLTTADGSTITVKTSGTTAVKVATAGTLKDLPPGSTVTVQGTAGADGAITATQVTGQK